MVRDQLVLRGGEAARRGSGLSPEKEYEMWRNLLAFLANNGLATTLPALSATPESIDFIELRYSNLTQTGQLVLRAGMDKWLKAMDRGQPASNLAALEKALKTVVG